MPINKVIAVYPGRFQPMGQHHAKTFEWLQNKFGASNVFIVTSDKVGPDSPFNFEEKKKIINAHGITNVVQTRSPYIPKEVLENYDPNTTAVVFLVGSKDMQENPRFRVGFKKDGSPSYYQHYEEGKNLQSFDNHGYLLVAPHVSLDVPGYGEMSGTQIRNALRDLTELSEEEQSQKFKQIMGFDNPSIRKMMINKLGVINESLVRELVALYL
jgi:phosphopantetheine adenylyltransferase